jgi:ubiquinone/menaquinone biosynthesis C-methylase UbiE
VTRDISLKDSVRAFWEAEPCGTEGVELDEGTPEFFAQLERDRVQLEPFIDRFARFSEQRGRRLLEVGVGPGTDFVRFVRAGAKATGIDLTAHGVELTRRRLALEGLEADVRQGDAEHLPFGDGAFDFVYSWGVIHHTEDPPRAAREIVRVTAPGGRVCVMVYHRRSLVAVQSWLVNGLARGKPLRPVRELIAEYHESAGTQAYTRSEARDLFVGLEDVSVTPVVTPYDLRIGRRRYLPASVGSVVPRNLGWFLVIEGRKPA